MGDAALTPWWVALGIGIATTLIGAIGKLWADNIKLRGEVATARDELDQSRLYAQQLTEQLHREHKRDLRKVIGWPTSLEPPALDAPLIREAPIPPRKPKK